jgi:transcriptional regulator with XRE-family HTH domain
MPSATTPNERLRSAMLRTGTTTDDLAACCGVDVKTVERWLSVGRVPHRANRWDAARRLGTDEVWLWPQVAPPRRDAATASDLIRMEISAVYPSQADASREIREHAATAARVDVLAVRGLGLLGLNDSELRGPLTDREVPVHVRVLLLDPDSPAVAVRAAETGESPESFGAGIKMSLARLTELQDHPVVKLEAAVYSSLPVWRMLAFDSTLFLSAFTQRAEGARSGMYKLTAVSDSVLHAGMTRQFEDMWRCARPAGGKG